MIGLSHFFKRPPHADIAMETSASIERILEHGDCWYHIDVTFRHGLWVKADRHLPTSMRNAFFRDGTAASQHDREAAGSGGTAVPAEPQASFSCQMYGGSRLRCPMLNVGPLVLGRLDPKPCCIEGRQEQQDHQGTDCRPADQRVGH